ncbi:MAG: hypothetical protein WCI60_04030 [bacterium]
MQNIIVLGMVPYTNIVLTFNEYLVIIGLISIVFVTILKKTNNFLQLRLSIVLLIIIIEQDIMRITKNIVAVLKINWQNRLSPEL